MRVNEWLQVLILGVIEGLTEFLPISSTAHLLIAGRLMGFHGSAGGAFEIAIQIGAVLAVVGYYARDLAAQARALPRDPLVRQFWLGIGVAFLPAAIVGLALHEFIKAFLFTSPVTIALALIVGGVVLIAVERRPGPPRATCDLRKVSLRQALGIGLAQTLALVPGVSRSGAAIVGGLLSGLDRRTATAFSFYLAIPTLGGATLIEMTNAMRTLAPTEIGYFVFGALVSAVVSWLSIGWLLRFVGGHSFVPFGIYRIALGLVVLGLAAIGVL
jgi:undecaprenyl-diphosphatase